jgi:hypothetical protein
VQTPGKGLLEERKYGTPATGRESKRGLLSPEVPDLSGSLLSGLLDPFHSSSSYRADEELERLARQAFFRFGDAIDVKAGTTRPSCFLPSHSSHLPCAGPTQQRITQHRVAATSLTSSGKLAQSLELETSYCINSLTSL